MFCSKTILAAASLASLAFARTDLSGCTSTDVSSPAGASIAWYVPGTGELCEFLDCGGGRAPPKTTVPGCPSYEGTETYSPSFLAGYASATAAPSEMTSATGALITDASQIESSLSSQSMIASITSSASVTRSAIFAGNSSMSTITSAAVAPAAGNGTIINTASSGNGTMTSRMPTASPLSDSGAMATARAWAGGAGLVGLGAIVMAL